MKKDKIIAPAASLDLAKTFECGQCFRWEANESGIYTGVARSRVLHIRLEGNSILCDAPESDLPLWKSYLDLDTDYAPADASFQSPDYLRDCAAFGKGIRILRQEPWEALCSFIISQCNNIPRIKKIISTLCALCGEELEDGVFAFPTPEAVAGLSEADLSPLRCGYRAPYIISAARAVCDGTINFDALSKAPADEALAVIKTLPGVGNKVASCFMLYGLHRMDRFPIDTWMKKALARHFPPDYDSAVLGDFAGLAQQYIFFYARTNEAW